jgi:hypothetical protein
MNEIVETKNDFEELQLTPEDEASEEIIKLETSQEDEDQEIGEM